MKHHVYALGYLSGVLL